MPGTELKGVYPALPLLESIAKGEAVNLGRKVVVIGGGNAAIDSARTSLRLGSEVTILYRRERKDMPAGVNSLEGIGVIEAPRGTLIHPYKVDENGAIVWANLIVATGHNNRAIGDSVRQVSEHFVHGDRLEEGMLNRVSAVVRAYDPCLSCSTHAFGVPAVEISLLDATGNLLDQLRSK